ncbi:MAG: hypothetical protein HYZ50_14770 [Deltaproteobacteria bacterium]|nr:hypothetical protein [Deltaproteobacteria bacterium]
MEIASIATGVASIILAFVAIWQAMYFYSKDKDTESRVEAALVGIKAQVDTLQTVNAKITERLTRYVTTPRNDTTQASELLAVTLRSLPEIALHFLPPSQATNEPALRNEITLAYVALWYYAASTNVWASFSLPRPEDFDPGKPGHAWSKHVVDQSATDFRYMSSLVSQLNQQEIQHPQFHYAHLYEEVTQYLQALIGDTSEHFARKAKE